MTRCLESVRRQTYPHIELLVIDNYSTDATIDVARQYTSLIFERGPERSAQVNFGVRKSSGEFIYKVDSDFELESTVVSSCVDEIRKGFDAVIVHNSPDVNVGWIARLRKFEVDMYKFDLTHSSARFMPRTVFERVGGFDESITAGEDYDFQNRLNAAGFRTGFVAPEALHLGEPTSLSGHMKKYFDYGRDFVVYAERNRKSSRQQLRFIRSVYVRNWRRFLRHPVLGGEFIAYNTLKYAFGGAGFVSTSISRWRAQFGRRRT